jgi:hypothetical protein
MDYRAKASEPPLVVSFGRFVCAVERATGARRWERDLDAEARLVCLEDRVLVLHSKLDCVDLATGKLVWRAAVAGATLLCDGAIAFVGDFGEVTAVRLDDGAVLWHEPFKGRGIGSVALAVPGGAAQADRTG